MKARLKWEKVPRKLELTEREVFVCDCNSLEHQLVIWHDAEDNFLMFEPRLVKYRGFFKRLWVGIRYAFGYNSRYGEWDDMIMKPRDIEALRNYLNDNAQLSNIGSDSEASE